MILWPFTEEIWYYDLFTLHMILWPFHITVKSNVITFYQKNIPSFKSNAIKSFNKLRNISYHKRDKQKGYELTALGEILDKVYKDIWIYFSWENQENVTTKSIENLK